MKTTINACALAAALLASGSALAAATQVVATENFQSYSNGTIVGANGGTGFAAGSVWQSDANSPAPAGSAPNVVTINGDQMLQFNSDRERSAYRNLNTSVTGEVVIRFEFQYTGNLLGDNDFLGLWFGNESGPSIGVKGNCGGSPAGCTDDAFTRLSLSTNKMLGNSNLTEGQTYVMFGHLYKGTGSTTYNKFDAWLDPTAQEMATFTNPRAQSSSAANTGISAFSQIGFRSANLNTGGVNVLVDDIELSVVPEPASIALFGASLLAFAGLRRRQK